MQNYASTEYWLLQNLDLCLCHTTSYEAGTGLMMTTKYCMTKEVDVAQSKTKL